MAHHEAAEGGYGFNMQAVAWSILVMGVSLAIIILLYTWFGWIPGSNFSDGIMREQQDQLLVEYGLPPIEEISPKEAEIPPSLRNLN